MKKIIACMIILLFLGCISDNPFIADPDVGWEGGNAHPHIIMAGTESGGWGSLQLNDLDPEIDGIQDVIILGFSDDILPSTINALSFVMTETFPGTGSFQFDSINYSEEIRTAVLSGTFMEETAYLLTVTAGTVTDLLGNELDPNHNALYDGSPWDDRLFTFATDYYIEMYDITPPGISYSTPSGGTVSDLIPDIGVYFHNGPMDSTYLTLDNFHMVRTSDSSVVELKLISVTSSSIVANPIDSLSYGTRYTVHLSADIADSSGNYLDSNGDGYVWPNEPDLVWNFQTEDDPTTPIHTIPPTIDNAVLMSGNNSVQIEFEQSLTGDDVVMDPNTFIAANIQVIDVDGSIPIVFETTPNPAIVICMLQRTARGTVTLYLSCNIADQYGNLFDGNNDGMGGIPGEDDWQGIL